MLDHAEVCPATAQRTFRYMKAIGTQPVVHRYATAPASAEVVAKLDALYPEDSGPRVRSRENTEAPLRFHSLP